MLERAFDCAQEVKSKQMALSVEQGQRDGKTEEAFFAGILFQRDQVRVQNFRRQGANHIGWRVGRRKQSLSPFFGTLGEASVQHVVSPWV